MPKTESETTVNWTDTLPEGFADAPFIKAAKTPEEAIAAIQNAATYMGNSIRVPGEDAGDEDRQSFYAKIMEKAPKLMFRPDDESMDEFYNSMGRPEDPSKYELEVPEGKELPSDFGDFSKLAHKIGLSNKQYKELMSGVLEQQWGNEEQVEVTQAEETKQLKDKWGKAYDVNLSTVKNFLRLTDAPEGIVDLISEGAMSATEMEWLNSIATMTKSKVELAEHEDTIPPVMTPGEAQDKIQEMLNNKEHPYWVAQDPRHKGAVQKMIQLQGYAHP